jgi:biopolymer transport protein ExbB
VALSRGSASVAALAALLGATASCTNDYDRFSVGDGGSAPTTSTTGTGGSTTVTMGGAGGAGGTSTTSGGGQGGVGGGVVCPDGACEPWWDADWTRRRRIEIDTTGATEALADFPVLIRLDPTRIDYASTMMDGQDVRFVAADGSTVLDRDVEAWIVAGTSSVWVKIPDFPMGGSGPLFVWMYYGNTGAPNPNNPKDVWSGDFTSVHHLNGDFVDASGNNHTGTGANLPSAQPGRVAGGMNFDGLNDRVDLSGEAPFDYTTALSVSAWVRVETFTKAFQTFVAKGDTAWRVHRDDTANKLGFGWTNSVAFGEEASGTTTIPFDVWRHIAVTYDGVTSKVYLDGVLDGSKAFAGPIAKNNVDVSIGENAEAPNRYFDGDLDELRISGAAVSASWLRLEHRTVADPAMLTFSAEQLPP